MSKLAFASIIATILMAIAVVAMALTLSFNLKQQHEDMRQLTEAVTAVVNSRTAATAEQPAQVANRAVSVNFFIAQDEEADDLTKLAIDGKDFWAQSEAALTQADLSSVAPVEDESGKPFLYFGFSEAGKDKLAQVTEAAKGKTMIVAVGGTVLGTIAIDEVVDNGRLGITTPTKQMAEQIAQAIVNGVPAQQQ